MALAYFVADVHLGLNVKDPADREARFVSFLRSLPPQTDSLYLLGDIWDFWYEYRDVVPKGYVKVFAAITDLIESGVKVYFFEGNHDVWTYHYFEELGMKKLSQPAYIDIEGTKFCLGHGDGLGPTTLGYRLLRGIFHNKFIQAMFSTLHPWIAFRLGYGWSKHNRLARNTPYFFKGKDESIYKFASEYEQTRPVDYFIFGHYHVDIKIRTPKGADLFVLKDWMDGSPYLYFDGTSILGGYFQNSEK